MLLAIFVIGFIVFIDIIQTSYFYAILLILIINKGIKNNVWGCNTSFIVDKIKGFFSIKDISKEFSEINNKGIGKGFWSYNINCNINEIEGSFLIDNINNKLLGIVLFGVSRLFVILLNTNIKSIVIKKTLIINIANRDNGLFIVNSVSIGNDYI